MPRDTVQMTVRGEGQGEEPQGAWAPLDGTINKGGRTGVGPGAPCLPAAKRGATSRRAPAVRMLGAGAALGWALGRAAGARGPRAEGVRSCVCAAQSACKAAAGAHAGGAVCPKTRVLGGGGAKGVIHKRAHGRG